MLFALGAGKGFLAHRETDGSLHIYTALPPRGLARHRRLHRHRGGEGAVLASSPDWDKSLKALVADADGALTPQIHALPIGHRWDRVPGVTLLGDAAHVMSPFAGEGANLAMLDGAELGEALAAHPGDTEAALAAYDQKLFPRSEGTGAGTGADPHVSSRAKRPPLPHRRTLRRPGLRTRRPVHGLIP
jgi:2-polyprenyl-6-methoxyphenol hydroxylase-like FAD-dependent oxidoreductase